MKDAKCADTNKKSIFRFLVFLDMIIFVLKIINFRWIFTITQKMKIGKIWNLIFLPIRPIPDLSCKFENLWIFFFFKEVKFTWKIQNRLNRKKNQISDFSDFNFSSYGHFLVILCRHHPNFRWTFQDNSKNKNRKIDFH